MSNKCPTSVGWSDTGTKLKCLCFLVNFYTSNPIINMHQYFVYAVWIALYFHEKFLLLLFYQSIIFPLALELVHIKWTTLEALNFRKLYLMSFLPCNYVIIVFEIILWYCAKCLILLVFNNKLLMQAQINFFTTMAVQTVKLSIHALLIPIYYPIIFSLVIFFVIHDFRLTFCLETKSTYSYFKKHMGLLCIIYLMTLGKLMRSKSNGEENMFPPCLSFLFLKWSML